MWRIIITVIIAIIVLAVAFGNLGFLSIETGLLGAFQEIPFLGVFVEVAKHMLGISTGNKLPVSEPLKDLIKLLILAIVMNFVDKILEWLMDTFDGDRPIDRLITKFNKLAWKFVFVMIAVLVTSSLIDSIFSILFLKLGTVLTYILGLILGGGLMALLVFVGIVVMSKSVVDILVKDVIASLAKLILMLWMYVVLYLMIQTGLSASLMLIFIILFGICLMIESVTKIFTTPRE